MTSKDYSDSDFMDHFSEDDIPSRELMIKPGQNTLADKIFSILSARSQRANSSSPIILDLKSGIIKIYPKNGKVIFRGNEYSITPKTRHFIALLALAEAEDNQLSYAELLRGNDTKSGRRVFGYVIRELKEKLGILPHTKKSLPDFIKCIKRVGYRLD